MGLPTILLVTAAAAWLWSEQTAARISDCQVLKKRIPIRQWDMDTTIYHLENRRVRLHTFALFAGTIGFLLGLRHLWE